MPLFPPLQPMLAHPKSSYVICTNPRSGSWLLSEALTATGVAGRPQEWFHDEYEQRCSREWKLPPPSAATYEGYLSRAIEAGTTANGVFGIKCHRYQFQSLPSKLGAIERWSRLSVEELVDEAFHRPRYVWLTRRDRARQAVSYYRAGQTGQWYEIAGQAADLNAHRELEFDFGAIARLERLLVENDAGWEQYFRSARVVPHIIYYEDFSVNYERTIRELLSYLEIPGGEQVPITPPRLKKQADESSDEWAMRYVAMKQARAATDPCPAAAPLAIQSIPRNWRCWIGENKLSGVPDDAIVNVLVSSGFDATMAAQEVARATDDPLLKAGEWMSQRYAKAVSLLTALRSLGTLDGRCMSVERRGVVSRTEFLERYYAANRPVILTELMGNWRAMGRWSPDFLKSACGDEVVEIMRGRNNDPHYETNSRRHKVEMTLGSFVDLVEQSGATNDHYLVANNNFWTRPGVKCLLDDIECFPEYLDPRIRDGKMFFWFGPAGTVTPLHHDTMNIFMAQVYGRKRVRLIPSTEIDFVYNNNGVFSEVDCDAPDFARFAKFARATVLDITLAPGEVLFLPVGWWHHVTSLDTSITVSFTNFVFPNQYDWAFPAIRK